ncbi:MAG: type I-C CRISPR-associated protein Cas8c/Csd1, partial [Oscillospiraceae bacterium]
MSWTKLLYETYNNLSTANVHDLMPICHSTQKAHVTITLDTKGDFLEAKLVEDIKTKDGEKNPCETLIPVTEKSASRSSGVAPHLLCDKLKYLAPNFLDYTGEDNAEYYNSYISQLEDWVNSDYSNEKVNAIYTYIKNGSIIQDLINQKIFSVNSQNQLTEKWENANI